MAHSFVRNNYKIDYPKFIWYNIDGKYNTANKRVSLMQKKENRWIIFVVPIVSSLSLVISVLTFLFGTFPYLNRKSSDILSKAKAGHVESQLFLAHYNYLIGNYNESVYWYKLLADNVEYNYPAVAHNNFCCALLLSDNFNDDFQSYDMICSTFLKMPADMNDQIVLHNISRVLGYLHASEHISLYYDQYNAFMHLFPELKELPYKEEIAVLDDYWSYQDCIIMPKTYLEYANERQANYLDNETNHYYVYLGFDGIYNEKGKNDKYELYYQCRFYEYKRNESKMKLTLQYINPPSW